MNWKKNSKMLSLLIPKVDLLIEIDREFRTEGLLVGEESIRVYY